jgi:hypothetical protein
MAGGDASADASRRAGSARDAASSSRPPKPLWRWHPSRGRPDERDDDPRWLARRKHFFILSDAGKPVWSRYGDAANLSGFAAAVSAMLASASEQLCRSSVDASGRSVANERVVSFALDGEKSGTSASSRSSHTCRVVCLSRNGLTYVALSRVPGESRAALTRQLRLLRYQTLFVLTSAVERAVLKSGSKFDPRRLLRDETGGADAALGALAHAATWDPGAFLGAWAPLPFSNTKRTLVHRALQRALTSAPSFGTSGDRRTNAKRARVFAAVVATATHVVAVAAEETRSTTKKRAAERDALPARPDDVYLLTHFARHVGAFRANDETFAPVCLPRRDPNTFAHAHVSFLSTREPTENENETETENDARGTFLVLVADEGGPDAFHAVRRCKEDVEKALRFKHAGSVGGGGSGSLSLLDAIERRVASPPRGIEPPSPANPRPGALARGSVRLADEVPRAAGGGGENRRVLHFLYVRPPLGQYVAPEWAAPLDGRDAQKKTLRAYRRVADAVSASAATSDEENEDSDSEPREVRHRRVPSRDGSQTSERGGGGGGGVHAGLTSFFQGLGLGGGVSARSGSGSGSPSGGARAPRAGGRKVTKAKGDVGERRKVHFESCAARVLLGFAGGDFELYVAMAPGTSRADAVAACNRLCTWLRQEEPRLFAAAA